MGAEKIVFCGCFGKVQYERGDFLPKAARIQTASEQVKSRLPTKLRLSKSVRFDSRIMFIIIQYFYKITSIWPDFLSHFVMFFPLFISIASVDTLMEQMSKRTLFDKVSWVLKPKMAKHWNQVGCRLFLTVKK